VNDDASVILGTQRDETNNIFRRPPLLQYQSTNINKRNSPRISSVNTNDDLQITAMHTLCTTGSSEKIKVFDAETQGFENRYKTTLSIHDMETQEFSEGMCVEANANTIKPSVNICNQTTTNTASDIQNMETQNDINVNDEDGNDIQKSKIICTQNQKDLDLIQQNIHELETQKYENERVINDICDAETQLKLDCNTNATKNTETQLKSSNIIDDQVDKDNNKNNTANADSSETNIEKEIKNKPKSRSSSPGSLNLSSSGIDDDSPPSLNDSTHLLETTDLLEYFGEGIDKHEEIRASNASTPKLCKEALSKKDNNVEIISNALDKEDDEDDEDIFNAPTQRINNEFETLVSDEIDKKNAFIYKMSKKMHEKSRPKQDNSDDSETDAEEYLEELAKEQRESVSLPRKLCNENISNNNDPGTSIESEDMFDVPTQQSNLIDNVQNTSNPSANHPAKINESNTIGNDTTPTQITEQIKDKSDQDERFSLDINDVPTQLLSHGISPKTASISRSLSLNDNVDETNMQIINTDDNIIKSPNLRALEDNYENADYELAPTQIIGEVENEKKTNFQCEKSNLDDTLERNLNKMFENVSNDSIQEPQQISTQCLEDILESSQCNNSLSTNEVSNVSSFINNTSQIQSKKSRVTKKRSSYDQPAAKTNASNVHNAESISQNSDIYFSTLSTRRKRNVLKDTEKREDSVNEIISSRQDTNSSKPSKTNMEKIDDDDIITRSNRRSKRTRKNKTLINNDDVNKIVSNEDSERKLRTSKMKRATAISETDKQILEEDFDEAKVDDPIKDSTSDPNIYIPYSLGEQSAQTSDTLYESDDNILMRLPAVRISGTLSNPVSPSGSSISISSQKFKQNATTNKKNKRSLKNKSLNKQDTERDKNLNQINDDKVSLLDNVKATNVMNTSEDSDSETNFKRFKQMANRMYNKLHYVKPHGKRTTQDTKSAVFDKKKNTHSSHNISKDSEQNADIESKNSLRIGTRTTRHSSRRNDDTHSHVLQKELGMGNITDKPLKSETKSNITNGKRFLTEEDIEQTNSKKRKTDKVSNIEDPLVSMSDRRNTRKSTRTIRQLQSPNMSEHSIETNSYGNLPVSEKFSADDKTTFKTTLEKTQKISHPKMHENVSSTRSRRTKHKANAAVMGESSDKTKQAATKIEKIANHLFNEGKTLKIILNPIIGNESQEVEMIMGRDLSNVQNENLLIKERSNVNILQRHSRIKSRKQSNANAEENSVIENSISSVIDSAESDNPALKAKRGRFAKKKSAPLLSEAKIPEKKDIFKKPVIDSYLGNLSTSENSQDSVESNVSSNSRSSRSKTTNKKKEKLGEMYQDAIDNNISSRVNISIGNISPVSTPSRTRRNTSSLNSTSIAARHKILFTGITEDYSKTIKMLGKYTHLFYLFIHYSTTKILSVSYGESFFSYLLEIIYYSTGGNKVDDPAKCTILVTDKVRRTYKFLCALAKGIPIVSIDWLKDSESTVQFLDWENYVLKDPVAEAKFGFRLRKSLDKAKEKRLLDGYTVILTSGVAPPPIEELKGKIK